MPLPTYSYCWLIRGQSVQDFTSHLVEKASEVKLNGHACLFDERNVGVNLQGNCNEELIMCGVLNRLLRYHCLRLSDVRAKPGILINEVTEQGFVLKPLEESAFRQQED